MHNLLDWLSDAEMKLRYAGQLPDDEEEIRKLIIEHESFMRELKMKEVEKDDTIAFAQEILAKAHPDGVATIKHWITIIQSRSVMSLLSLSIIQSLDYYHYLFSL